MARIWTDGAETGDILFWSATTGTVTASSAQARSGSYSYSLPNTGTTATKTCPNTTTIYIRFGFRTNAGNNNDVISFYDTGLSIMAQLEYLPATDALRATRGTGTTLQTAVGVVPSNTWVLIEIYYFADNTAGNYVVKVDGVTVINYQGDTTNALTTLSAVQFSGEINVYIDDLALNDTTGGTDNSWCGEGRVVLQVVNAAGDSADWTPSAGANWQCVDEIPPDGDTSYVESATPGALDLYAIADFAGNDREILRVQPIITAKGTVGGEQITAKAKLGLAEYDWGTITLTMSYAQYRGDDQPTSPATGNPWDDSEIDALQIGQEVV